MNTACGYGAVFPGQGSQRVGMARDFHDAFAESRSVFEKASQALDLDVAALCFEEDPRLAATEFQQPAILAAEIAMLAGLRTGFGFAPARYGGHSLGEYSALVAAGVIDVGDAVRLVRERGRLMQEAVPIGEGGMTAVIRPGLDAARLRALLEEAEPVEVDIANLNSPDQVVLSGRVVELSRAAERLREDASFARARAIPLRVSAPFHSRLMAPAAERFRPLLDASSRSWRVEHAVLVVSNYTGTFFRPDREGLVEGLYRQICAPVLWLDCMNALLADCDRIFEVGPGKPLAGFFKGLGQAVTSITDTESAAQALSS